MLIFFCMICFLFWINTHRKSSSGSTYIAIKNEAPIVFWMFQNHTAYTMINIVITTKVFLWCVNMAQLCSKRNTLIYLSKSHPHMKKTLILHFGIYINLYVECVYNINYSLNLMFVIGQFCWRQSYVYDVINMF